MTTKLKRLAILIGLSTILSVNSYSTLDDSLVARSQIEKTCEMRQSQRLEQRISDFKRDEKPGIYALLVAGSETPLETWTKAGREEFYISTKIAYECLKKKRVDPDNIFVLDKLFNHKCSDIQADHVRLGNEVANRSGLIIDFKIIGAAHFFQTLPDLFLERILICGFDEFVVDEFHGNDGGQRLCSFLYGADCQSACMFFGGFDSG